MRGLFCQSVCRLTCLSSSRHSLSLSHSHPHAQSPPFSISRSLPLPLPPLHLWGPLSHCLRVPASLCPRPVSLDFHVPVSVPRSPIPLPSLLSHRCFAVNLQFLPQPGQAPGGGNIYLGGAPPPHARPSTRLPGPSITGAGDSGSPFVTRSLPTHQAIIPLAMARQRPRGGPGLTRAGEGRGAGHPLPVSQSFYPLCIPLPISLCGSESLFWVSTPRPPVSPPLPLSVSLSLCPSRSWVCVSVCSSVS